MFSKMYTSGPYMGIWGQCEGAKQKLNAYGGCMHACMHMDGCVDGWMDGWMDANCNRNE